MSARDDLMHALWDNYRQAEKNHFIDAYRDEVALEIGRDALRDGLVPTLTRLVGEANATKLMADLRNAFAHELAERLRARGNDAMAEADTNGGRTTPSDPKYNKAAAWYAAADLIGPLKDTT